MDTKYLCGLRFIISNLKHYRLMKALQLKDLYSSTFQQFTLDSLATKQGIMSTPEVNGAFSKKVNALCEIRNSDGRLVAIFDESTNTIIIQRNKCETRLHICKDGSIEITHYKEKSAAKTE